MHITELTGQLLLAMPTLQDPNFSDSVVLICHHDTDGCMGLIVNRLRDVTLQEVLEDLDIWHAEPGKVLPDSDRRVFDGGPVDEFRGFILHDGWHVYDSTMQVTSELHLTASRDILEAIAKGEGPEHYMLLLGYAGWGSGQLEQELSNNDWIVAPASHHILFQEPPEGRWAFGARCMGIDRSNLSDQIGHA
ncbi:MAG TPA: YqgE/AlgH family protein [Mariprofundaceae bacterium]|nr:YqgE/AlgH family protein [Mariprofundaceae bacterium]